ncbi:MAG: hypothetical protein ACRYF2_01650 [Janthinobacterium lividum]
MTADEVRSIANTAALAAGYSLEPMDPQPCRTGERLVWTVVSATKGSGWQLEIDDATGVAGSIERWGLR